MPFFIALIIIVVVAYLWINHTRYTSDIGVKIDDSVRLTAQRLRPNHKIRMRPVESIEDNRLAIAAIGAAFIKLDVLPTSRQRQVLTAQMRSILMMDSAETQKIIVLGRCLTVKYGGAERAIARLSCKLYKLFGIEQIVLLVHIPKLYSNDPSGAVEDIKPSMRH